MGESSIPGKSTSPWIDTTALTQCPSLSKHITTDVLIVGAGIVGVSTARFLAAEGIQTTLIDGSQILRGVTGFTTAKLTSLHGLKYRELTSQFGCAKAKLYAEANEWAIRYVREEVQRNDIDCDFETDKAYTYSRTREGLKQLEEELRAAEDIGLSVNFENPSERRFPIEGALCLKNQARFHPRKYFLDMAQRFLDQGGTIYENTRALSLDERDDACYVATSGSTIKCQTLVMATHYPFYDPAYYYARLAQYRSYAIAVTLNEPLPVGMFITHDDPIRSMRRHTSKEGEFLIIGGEGHKVGQELDTNRCYQALVDWANAHFSVDQFLYHWSTQDNETADGLPYVGRASTKTDRVLVATGFDGWGMSNGIASARLLADIVLKRENPWEELFDPNRSEMRGVGKILREGANVAQQFVGGLLRGGKHVAPTELLYGEGKIISTENGVVAAYRDEAGCVHQVSARCPHMGCNVTWNTAEKSWDCPCHGSRFNAMGEVIHGPAVQDLEPISEEPLEARAVVEMKPDAVAEPT